jgi:hypothetical protein
VVIKNDGDGNRVLETIGGVTTRYLVDTLNPTGYAQVEGAGAAQPGTSALKPHDPARGSQPGHSGVNQMYSLAKRARENRLKSPPVSAINSL